MPDPATPDDLLAIKKSEPASLSLDLHGDPAARHRPYIFDASYAIAIGKQIRIPRCTGDQCNPVRASVRICSCKLHE